MNKSLGMIVVSMAVGGLITWAVLKSDSVALQSTPANLDAIKAKFQQIHDEDFQDYLRLKEHRAKYEKANEILGKIMVLFLAELGLKMNSGDIEKIQEKLQIANAEEFLPTSSSPTQECRAGDSGSRLGQHSQQNQAGTNTNNSLWKENEKSLRDPKSPKEIDDFLKKVEIEDFFSEIRSAKSVGPQVLEKFVGVYEGTLTFKDPEREPFEVFVELDAEAKEGKNTGDYKVVLYRNGEPMSQSTGNGDVEFLKQVAGADKAIFLQIGGRSGYFQLYFVNGNKGLIGNYYAEKELANFVIQGQVSMTRK